MKLIAFLIGCFLSTAISAEDGYRLWLRYDLVDNPTVLQGYNKLISSIQVNGESPTAVIIREELSNALRSMLGKKIPIPWS